VESYCCSQAMTWDDTGRTSMTQVDGHFSCKLLPCVLLSMMI
jgi:hypothetical protein